MFTGNRKVLFVRRTVGRLGNPWFRSALGDLLSLAQNVAPSAAVSASANGTAAWLLLVVPVLLADHTGHVMKLGLGRK